MVSRPSLSKTDRDMGLFVVKYWFCCHILVLSNKLLLLGEIWNMSFLLLALQVCFYFLLLKICEEEILDENLSFIYTLFL